ncbi:hypothetical protein BCR43DRAFT_447738 [Syncephalastrum racemosum]|uniref:Uncharacterized protein n=1 Tax=Syncephalastrum racemosum TaxID=13706 RepID=A0A1X2H0K4_SYNRA|nr:hypothetical protein BCR43DRAFT_447738 [Syncephalastrum racemosum]
MDADFFRSKLDDNERRKFLFDCPKNAVRQYEPPTLNRVPSMGDAARKADQQLRDVQYRLSGLTRPLDWYAYQSTHSNWDANQLLAYSQSLVRNMAALLADVASHITDLRVAGLLSGVDAQQRSADNPLVPTEDLLEQLKLARSLHEATQPAKKPGHGKRKGARPQRRTQAVPAASHQSTACGTSSSHSGPERPQGEWSGFHSRNQPKSRHQ